MSATDDEVLFRQVKEWEKEIARLQGMIAAATGDKQGAEREAGLSALRELLGHISDVLPDEAFDKIDTAKWNAVSAIVGESDLARSGQPAQEGRVAPKDSCYVCGQPAMYCASKHHEARVAPSGGTVAWLNYPVKTVNGEFAGYGDPELHFKRLANGYDVDKARPLVFGDAAPQPSEQRAEVCVFGDDLVAYARKLESEFAKLQSPAGVHQNMLAGKIAKISMEACAHTHGEEVARRHAEEAYKRGYEAGYKDAQNSQPVRYLRNGGGY